MSLLDLLESIAGAPRTGMGAGPGVAGGAPAAGGSSPPMCQPPMPDLGDPGSPLQPMSWDPALDGSLGADAGSPAGDGGNPAGDGDGGGSGDEGSFTKDRIVLDQLDKYHDWMTQDDSLGKRALRAVPGLVILPMGAVLACLEDTIRSPVPGVTIDLPRLSR